MTHRRAEHAGSWYTDDPAALASELDGYLAAAKADLAPADTTVFGGGQSGGSGGGLGPAVLGALGGGTRERKPVLAAVSPHLWDRGGVKRGA